MSDPQHPPYVAPPASYAAPYAAPQHPQFAQYVAEPAAASRGRALGVVALVLALVALIVTPIVGAVSAFAVGIAYGAGMNGAFATADPETAVIEWSLLSPARDAVLWGEIAFWAGTVLGVWAIAQGIVALVKRRGRGQGIAAIIVAAVAFFVFGLAVFVAFVGGLTTAIPLGM